MRNQYRVWIAIGGLALAALACNTPGQSAPTVTTGAPAVESPTGAQPAAPTSTTGAAAPTSPPQPTNAPAAQPTSAPAAKAQRISFAVGAISASVQGTASPSAAAVYLVNAGQGQTMTLTLTGTGAVLGVKSPAGASMQDASAGKTTFSGQLPQTGDYTITVAATAGAPVQFALQVVIPPAGASNSGGGNAQCWVTTATALDARRESSPLADVFGQAAAGEKTLALAHTNDGWVGFDPGVAQAGNQGRARLRWYQAQGASLSFDPAGCDSKLPLVLSLQSLQNGTYPYEKDTATLSGGKYTNASFDPTGATGSSIAFASMLDATAFGDLNGDGSEDAVIVLAVNTGGSGTFVSIVPVLNVNGSPQPAGAAAVGDRTPVTALSIDSGIVTANVTVDGPNDPACCPTVQQTWTLKLVNGALVVQ